MIFAFSPGSDGSGPERYMVSIPFTVAPGYAINMPATPVIRATAESTPMLEKLHHLYSLKFGPYAMLEDAEDGLSEVAAALLWVSLSQGVGIKYAKDRRDPTVFQESSPINETGLMGHMRESPGWDATDGHYDAEYSIILPDHKRLVRWEAGRATLTVGVDVESFIAHLREALQFPNLRAVAIDEKLKLAIELCAGHRFELSANAQFFALVTSLEALLPDMLVSQSAAAALGSAAKTVRGVRDQHAKGTQEWADLSRLLSRVGELKHESIGMSLKAFVGAAIARNPDLGDEHTVIDNLRAAYSTRSRLLHDGIAELQAISSNLTFLRDFVPRLLTALFKEKSGCKHEGPLANAP